MQILLDFFTNKNSIPHGYCLSWNLALLWLHVVSDLLITLSYYSIPLTLAYFIRKRKDIPYAWLIAMGGLFIVACGTTHLMSAIVIWKPLYWLDGFIKAFTALISIATALAMLRVIPLALQMPSTAQLQTEIKKREQAQLEQQKAIERLEKIASRLPGMVFQYRLNPDGSSCFPYASSAIHDVYQVTPEEVQISAAKIFAIIHPDDYQSVINSTNTSAQNLTPWQQEYRVQFSDGTVRWLWGNALPQREEDGAILWHGFITDITERKQIANEILDSKNQLQATLEAIPDLLFELDQEGRYIDYRAHRAELLVVPPEQLLGQKVSEILPSAAAETVMSALHEAQQYGWSTGKQIQLKLPHGVHWFELSVAVRLTEDTNAPHFIVLSRDISNRKLAEQQLQESEERLNLSQEYSGIGSWEADLLTNRQIWSRAVYQLIKLPELANPRWEDFLAIIHPDDRQKILDANQAHLTHNEKYDVEYRVILAGNEMRWMRSTGRAQFAPDGTPVKFIGIVQDITERKLTEEMLHFHSNILQNIAEGVLLVRADDALIVFANPQFDKLFGYQAGELLGQHVSIVNAPTDKTANAVADEIIAKLQQSGRWAGEVHNIRKDGTTFWCRASVASFQHPKYGQVWVSVHDDISARKAMENEMRKSEQRLNEAERIAQLGNWEINLLDNHLDWSDGIFRIFEINKTQFDATYESFLTTIHPDDRHLVNAAYMHSLETRKPYDVTHRLLMSDGRIKYVCERCETYYNAEGKPIRSLGTVQDITERKQVEEKLRELNRDFVTFLENTSDFIYFKDQNHRIRFCSQTLANITQHKSWRDLVGKHDLEIFPKETAEIYYEEELPVFEQGQALINKVDPYFNKDGTKGWVSTCKWPVFDFDNQKVIGIFGISRDITQLKQTEQDLLRSNADLEQFAYSVSHDMRQPLRSVSSHLQLLARSLKGKLDEDENINLNFALEGAKRMDAMILSLLDYSRVGRKTETKAWLNSRIALDEALEFLSPAIAEARVEVKITGEWAEIFASHDELTRLFLNLIGNAIKYRETEQPPWVEIDSVVSDKTWKVSVRDYGIGIDPQQMNRLFKFFSRLQARSRFEGTGMGLALCRRIVEHHGGEIWVESAGEGEGCCFIFELPLLNKETENNQHPAK